MKIRYLSLLLVSVVCFNTYSIAQEKTLKDNTFKKVTYKKHQKGLLSKKLESLALTESQVNEIQNIRKKLEARLITNNKKQFSLIIELKQALTKGSIDMVKSVLNNQHKQKQDFEKIQLEYTTALLSVLDKKQMGQLANNPKQMKQLIRLKSNKSNQQRKKKKIKNKSKKNK